MGILLMRQCKIGAENSTHKYQCSSVTSISKIKQVSIKYQSIRGLGIIEVIANESSKAGNHKYQNN